MRQDANAIVKGPQQVLWEWTHPFF